MSTEPHSQTQSENGEPRHGDVSFEPLDVQVGTIYWYLAGLGLSVVLSLLACVYIFRFTAGLAQKSDTPPTAAMQQMTEKMTPEQKEALQFPESSQPRLQGVPGHASDPQEDLRQKIAADQKENERLGWIDQSNGVAQIPVSEAMKIIAEKGLPPIAREKKK
jgi:hypothetical protein